MTPLPSVPGDGPVLLKASTLRDLVQAIRERTPLPANGQSLERRSMGFVLEGGRPVVIDHPLRIRVQAVPEGLGVKVSPGTVGGFYPTMGGVSLIASEPPYLLINPSLSYFVVLVVNAELSEAAGYIHSGVVSSVSVQLSGQPPQSSDLVNGTGPFVIHLGRIVQGRVVAQAWASSLSVGFCDVSSPETALAQMHVHGGYGYSLLPEEET